MVPVMEYGSIVRAVIREYASVKPSYGEVEVETVFDEPGGHYELVYAGWLDQKRIHGSVVHIDVRGDRVWIQHDGTSTGVANDLIERGIPEGHLVLAFQHPSLRATG
ncbi:MAG: XisI protein [Deltaproteobacteria bacterium]|nr:XisI protein [Deltaproteobacteria bacterium]